MKPFRTLAEVEEYFSQFTNYERVRTFQYTRDVLDLDRVREVLSAVGNPENDAPIFHIAGTKGKGSVCAMIASILCEAGYRVGLFSKPHLIKLNERFSINGQDISDEELISVMNRLHSHLEAQRATGKPLTFFEIITVIALRYFSDHEVDFVILETGLGGRLDSTNVVTPLVSVITSIDYDHTHILGDTLEKIAAEKAGIIKNNIPVISGVDAPGPAQVIEEKTNAESAQLFLIGRDFQLYQDKARFSVQTWRARYDNLRLRLLGKHQQQNAAVAVAAIEVAREKIKLSVSNDQIRDGLAKAEPRGRIEVLSQSPCVILDVAHNPSSLRALRETLIENFPNHSVILLMGMAKDKEIDRSLHEILPIASQVIFTGIGHVIEANPEELLVAALHITNKIPMSANPDIDSALQSVLQLCGPEKLVCVTGSFYLAGEVAKRWDAVKTGLQTENDSSH
ncbi:bifunctional folylpolyglutamate synthase/dihydrofolate synthase [Candidatus Acetothermia bacterium]|nr:bifunctional folylpolyglutamate synthase/dihydrofolate synthase [Candidatus Acetothermia bacterium]MBI3643321.1 bifunctional folylpolyglutamate synthase/dihydrofolate synthase [Candidatus Acetothermia bacterium]